MPIENKCPQCGKPVSPNALMGLCPDCMLKAGLGSGATSGPGGAHATVAPPPTPAELARYFPQLEILELLSQGKVSKEIADQLAISYHTVRVHLKHIYEKLHVRSQAEAMVKYMTEKGGPTTGAPPRPN